MSTSTVRGPARVTRGLRRAGAVVATARRVPVLGVVLLIVASVSVSAGCTPRDGYAKLDNRTSFDLVAYDGDTLTTAGGGDRGRSGRVVVGDPGDCIDSIHLVTQDGSRMAIVNHPVCDKETVVVDDAQLVPAGSVALTNTSGVDFDGGHAGAVAVPDLASGEEVVLHLPMPPDGCVPLPVQVWAFDEDRQVIADAAVADRVCDGDRLTVAQEMVEVQTAEGWQWLVPRSMEITDDAHETAPPASPPASPPVLPTAMVTVTNSTDLDIVANLGSLAHVALASGQSGQLPLRVASGACEPYRVFVTIPSDPYQGVPPGDVVGLCAGDTVVLRMDGFAVLGDDGAAKVDIRYGDMAMAMVTVTNSTDVEIQAQVGGLESRVLAPGQSAEIPLRTDVGECVARRLSADIPFHDQPVETEMMEVCDGDVAVVTTAGITVG